MTLPALGAGIDAVDVGRFQASISRHPGLLRRCFTDAERRSCMDSPNATERLAARFAAKEATMKALGVGLGGVSFHDIEVMTELSGQPVLNLSGRAASRHQALGGGDLSVSMTHAAGVAMAIVVRAGCACDRS